MKNTLNSLIISWLILASAQKMIAQNYNWQKLNNTKNIAGIYTGLDYAIVYGVHYGRIVSSKHLRVIPHADFSLPLGKQFLDDNKLRIGTAFSVFHIQNWVMSSDISLINRQFSTPFAKMNNLGLGSALQFGFYKEKWFCSFNLDNDYAFTTHITHTKTYKSNYANAQDGWYKNTAVNTLLGISTGLSLAKFDITLAISSVRNANFSASSNLPFYSKLGFNYRF